MKVTNIAIITLCFCAAAVTLAKGDTESTKINKKRQLPINVNPRIIGGSPAPPNKYPWFARATTNNHARWKGCGGVLVSPEFVLTAAHCVDEFFVPDGGYEIGALCYPYNKGENCGQGVEKFSILKMFKHPKHDPIFKDNDLALMRLSGISSVTPIKLDQNSFVSDYTNTKKLWAIGFGFQNRDGTNPALSLMHTELSFVDQITCKNAYGKEHISKTMMCAAETGRDTCQGDSGGPLYDPENNVVVGITSWGYGCATDRYPGVYANVSKRWKWIKNTICENHKELTKPSFCFGNTPQTIEPTSTPLLVTSNPTIQPTNNPPTLLEPTTLPIETCNDNESELVVSVTTDFWPEETSYVINGNDLTIHSEVYDMMGYTYTNTTCLDKKHCYSFTIFDSYGDGIQHGQYIVKWDGIVIDAGGNDFNKSKTVEFGDSCKSLCGKDKKMLEIELVTDNFGFETSWTLYKQNNKGKFKEYSSGGIDKSYESNSHYVERECIPKSKCWELVVEDAYGDGLSAGEGFYELKRNGKAIKKSDFKSSKKREKNKFGKCKTTKTKRRTRRRVLRRSK